MNNDMKRRPMRYGETAWTVKLSSCSCVTLYDADARQARIEVDGVTGSAWNGEGGLCIGIQLAGTDADFQWVSDTTIWLAAIPEASDDAIARDEHGWVLWRRYDHALSAAQLNERIPALLALVNRLVNGAETMNGSTAAEIGRLI
jgi:hypothetical protein